MRPRTVSSILTCLPIFCVLPVCALIVGCEGKTLVDDNPVFSAAPPRRSLTNSSTVAQADDTETVSAVQTVSATETSGQVLTGNSVVAEVNGNPIFLDDLIGSLRLSIEADPQFTPEQRQKILYAQVQGRLAAYVEQEIVLDAVRQAVPEDRRDSINATLEEPFQGVIANIKQDRGVTTDEELNEALKAEGLSIDLLRESFIRIQMVQGYLSTLAPAPESIDRIEMVNYYQDHLDDYTTEERLRWQEIVVLDSKHGGRPGAEQHMNAAVAALKKGEDFGAVALKYSDALSAERRGDMGWLKRDALADRDLEKTLFTISSGKLTSVYRRSDRLELYRVADHQQVQTTPFAEVQSQIEEILRKEAQKEARRKALEDLRARSTVVTMFDGQDGGIQRQ